MIEDPAEFMRRYAENTDAHRLEATLAMIADDAIYLFSDGSSHVGKPAIAEVLEKNFAAIVGETYRIGDMRWPTCRFRSDIARSRPTNHAIGRARRRDRKTG